MPEVKTTHPTDQQLTDYGLGKLPKAQLSVIHQHLVACPVCRAKVEKQAPDSFIGQLRAAGRGGAQSATPPPSASNTSLPARKAAPGKTCDDVPAELAASSKYEILGKLGQGGMGSVYKARHTFLDELVAIKVMNADVVADPEARSRFLREMKSAGKLKHPNIVRALDAEQVGDVLVLVMELVPGITLEHLVKQRGALPVDFACNCIMQAAEGLQHAHEKGMVHRDIKPANLIVTPKDQAIKVLDFGLARGPREQNSRAKQTALETFMGTPEYVAPEQAVDARSADIRADVYSLGCTLYCLLAGRPPFQADTPTNTIIAQIEDEAPPLTELRPEVPVALGAVVAKMLAKKPAERYQTPIDVARALQPFVSGGAKARRAEARPGTGLKGDPGPPPPPPSRVRPAPEPQRAEESPFAVSSGMRAPAAPARPRRENAKAKGKRSSWVVGAVGAACLVSMSLVALVVLTLNTSKGKVVVEIDQADAQVFVDGKKMSIQVAGEMQPIEIQVDEGNHELKVKKDGFETVTREFSYSKGKKPVVRVSMETKKQVAAGGSEKPPVRPGIAPVKPEPVKPLARLDPDRKAAEADKPGVPKIVTVDVGEGVKMEFALIPKGKFKMGAPKDETGGISRDEGAIFPETRHDVEITRPFYLAKYPVTQEQYVAITGRKNPSWFSKDGGRAALVQDLDTKHFPVDNISWDDAKACSADLSRKDTKGRKFRLPTEAEWEYACRAGTETVYFCGDDPQRLGDYAWYQDNSNGRTHPVGEKKPNPWGLHEMHGTVWQWCEDYYGPYEGLTAQNPLRKAKHSGDLRVLRGGSFARPPLSCRAASRAGVPPGLRHDGTGIRLALDCSDEALVPSDDPDRKAAEAGKPGVPKRVRVGLGGGVKMEFALVPKGKAWLGGSGGKPGDREVEFKQDFYLGVYEVTQGEWQQILGTNPSCFRPGGRNAATVRDVPEADLKRFPVENVSWHDAQGFLEALNKRAPANGWTYRLPMEAEWEYACRGGPMMDRAVRVSDFYFDRPTLELLSTQANFKHPRCPQRTCKVGSYPPNGLGLYDMHGNVIEWCADKWLGAGHRYRGGCWSDGAERCRAGFVFGNGDPRSHDNYLGLRVARVPVANENKAAASLDPDRKAAEYVLSIGGTVRVNDEERDIRAVADLPSDMFRLTYVEVSHNPKLNDEGLAHFKGCKNLTILNLWVTKVSSAGLAYLKDCKKLTNLSCESTLVSDLSPLKDMKLTFFCCKGAQVKDLSPLEGMNLAHLECTNTQVSDLSPLKDMKLTSLGCAGTKVSDLSPLKNMKLTSLDCCGTQVSDLSPLKDMKLTTLICYRTKVSDLSPLKDMKLTRLFCSDTKVSDLSPLKGMPLNDLWCDFKPERDTEILRSIKTLEKINEKPAEEFWKKVDAGRKELPPTKKAAEGFRPLFNGKDKSGWKTHPAQPGNWRVQKGILIGSSNGVSHLYTTRGDYTNFHLRLEARLNAGAGFISSGVYFRTQFGPSIPARVRMPASPSNPLTWLKGYNAKFDAGRLGGLLIDPNPGLHRTREPVLRPREWVTYDISAEGNHVVLKVNGETTCDHTDEQRLYTKGYIVLQQHGAATVVEFRKIEIKELPAR